MKRFLFAALILLAPLRAGDELADQLITIHRIYVDRLTGGETAAQMRDLLISALQSSKLFIVTENEQRADAFLRGAAEDLIYTDTFSSSDNVSIGTRGSSGSGSYTGTGATRAGNNSRQSGGISLGERESTDVKERRHEAMASVRLVNKDGDVLWSTTQESGGAKFKGASADVADKITRVLMQEIDRIKKSR